MPASRPVLASTVLAALLGGTVASAPPAAAAADAPASASSGSGSVTPVVTVTSSRTTGLVGYSCVVLVTGAAVAVESACDVFVDGAMAASSPVSLTGPVPAEAGVLLVPAGAQVTVCSSTSATYLDGHSSTVRACASPLETV